MGWGRLIRLNSPPPRSKMRMSESKLPSPGGTTTGPSSRAANAEAVLAGLDGVLELLEKQSETSEPSYNAYCLLGLVRGKLAEVLREGGQR